MALIIDVDQTIAPKLIFGGVNPLLGYLPDQHHNIEEGPEYINKRNALTAEKFNEFERLLSQLSQYLGDVTTGFNNKTLGQNIRDIKQTIADAGIGVSTNALPFHFWMLGGNIFSDPENNVDGDNSEETKANMFKITWDTGRTFIIDGGISTIGTSKLNANIVEVANPITMNELPEQFPDGVSRTNLPPEYQTTGLYAVDFNVVGDNVLLDDDEEEAADGWSNGEAHNVTTASFFLNHKYIKSDVFSSMSDAEVVAIVEGDPDNTAYANSGTAFTVNTETGEITPSPAWVSEIGSGTEVKFYYLYYQYRRDLVIIRSDEDEPSLKVAIRVGEPADQLSETTRAAYDPVEEEPIYEIILYPFNNALEVWKIDMNVASNVIDLRQDINISNDKWKAIRDGVIRVLYNDPIRVDDKETDQLSFTLMPHEINIDGRAVITKTTGLTIIPDATYPRIAAIVADGEGNVSILHGTPAEKTTFPALTTEAYVRFLYIEPGITNLVLDSTVFDLENNPFRTEVHSGETEADAGFAYALYHANMVNRVVTNPDVIAATRLLWEYDGTLGNEHYEISLYNFNRMVIAGDELPTNIHTIIQHEYTIYTDAITIPSGRELVIYNTALFRENLTIEDEVKIINNGAITVHTLEGDDGLLLIGSNCYIENKSTITADIVTIGQSNTIVGGSIYAQAGNLTIGAYNIIIDAYILSCQDSLVLGVGVKGNVLNHINNDNITIGANSDIEIENCQSYSNISIGENAIINISRGTIGGNITIGDNAKLFITGGTFSVGGSIIYGSGSILKTECEIEFTNANSTIKSSKYDIAGLSVTQYSPSGVAVSVTTQDESNYLDSLLSGTVGICGSAVSGLTSFKVATRVDSPYASISTSVDIDNAIKEEASLFFNPVTHVIGNKIYMAGTLVSGGSYGSQGHVQLRSYDYNPVTKAISSATIMGYCTGDQSNIYHDLAITDTQNHIIIFLSYTDMSAQTPNTASLSIPKTAVQQEVYYNVLTDLEGTNRPKIVNYLSDNSVIYSITTENTYKAIVAKWTVNPSTGALTHIISKLYAPGESTQSQIERGILNRAYDIAVIRDNRIAVMWCRIDDSASDDLYGRYLIVYDKDLAQQNVQVDGALTDNTFEILRLFVNKETLFCIGTTTDKMNINIYKVINIDGPMTYQAVGTNVLDPERRPITNIGVLRNSDNHNVDIIVNMVTEIMDVENPVEENIDVYPTALGRNASLIDKDGNIHVVYFADGECRYRCRTRTGWGSAQSVDSALSTIIGGWACTPRIVMDSNGLIGIIIKYYDSGTTTTSVRKYIMAPPTIGVNDSMTPRGTEIASYSGNDSGRMNSLAAVVDRYDRLLIFNARVASNSSYLYQYDNMFGAVRTSAYMPVNPQLDDEVAIIPDVSSDYSGTNSIGIVHAISGYVTIRIATVSLSSSPTWTGSTVTLAAINANTTILYTNAFIKGSKIYLSASTYNDDGGGVSTRTVHFAYLANRTNILTYGSWVLKTVVTTSNSDGDAYVSHLSVTSTGTAHVLYGLKDRSEIKLTSLAYPYSGSFPVASTWLDLSGDIMNDGASVICSHSLYTDLSATIFTDNPDVEFAYASGSYAENGSVRLSYNFIGNLNDPQRTEVVTPSSGTIHSLLPILVGNNSAFLFLEYNESKNVNIVTLLNDKYIDLDSTFDTAEFGEPDYGISSAKILLDEDITQHANIDINIGSSVTLSTVIDIRNTAYCIFNIIGKDITTAYFFNGGDNRTINNTIIPNLDHSNTITSGVFSDILDCIIKDMTVNVVLAGAAEYWDSVGRIKYNGWLNYTYVDGFIDS